MTPPLSPDPDYIIPFQAEINSIPLPEKFTFPFNYEPHPLCVQAAKELQQYITGESSLGHNFGLDNNRWDALGKMFGVLIVMGNNKKIGYLAAYSGKLGGRNDHQHFVPPIVNLLDEEGFYRKGEKAITEITHSIERLEKDPAFHKCQHLLNEVTLESEKILTEGKQQLKTSKKDRQRQREEGEKFLSPKAFEALCETLKKESMDGQYAFRRVTKEWKERLAVRTKEVEYYTNQIQELKTIRKEKSADLQKEIFSHFNFLSFKGEEKSLYDIFLHTVDKIPPGGAGECAAPKLLQYAYENGLTPLAMAEFWWGKSPKLEVRRHGQFYPACRRKCEPILGHMLKGLDVEENPMLKNPGEGKEIKIVFEDEYVLVINKPAEFLSVPGKKIEDSVYSRIKNKYPDATGPLIVHRLDMSTSGLMVLAKTKDAHKHLQKQFQERSVKKYYIALLDGLIKGDEGLIDLPLRVDLDNRPQQMVCYEHGKRALTQWTVLERTKTHTRIRFYPITGRTHQLRVHSAHPDGLNTPILGDDIYGHRHKRLHLHAQYLKFIHPVTQKKVTIIEDPEF